MYRAPSALRRALEFQGDELEQRLHATTDILHYAIHEERGSCPQVTALATCLVFANPLSIDFIIELGLEAYRVQSDLGGVRLEMSAREVVRIAKQQIVHRPELPLCAGGFGGFRRHQGVGVGVFERKVPKYERHLRVQSPQLLDGGLDRDTDRALEVAILEYDDWRVLGARKMIVRRHGHGQGGHSMGLIHLNFSGCQRTRYTAHRDL